MQGTTIDAGVMGPRMREDDSLFAIATPSILRRRKHSSATSKNWIASSLTLLAMKKWSWPGLSRPSRLGRHCAPDRGHRDEPGDDKDHSRKETHTPQQELFAPSANDQCMERQLTPGLWVPRMRED